MIKTFQHRGLKRLYERGKANRLAADHVKRIEDVLAHLDAAGGASELALSGYRLHRLKGDLRNVWSVRNSGNWISGNWRITFRFEHGNAFDDDLVDYH